MADNDREMWCVCGAPDSGGPCDRCTPANADAPHPIPHLPRRVRTQAERDTDGTTWHPGGVVAGAPARIDLPADECVVVAREGVGLMCARTDHDHSPLAEAQAAISRVMEDHLPALGEALAEMAAQPRRRWWHRYTRRPQ